VGETADVQIDQDAGLRLRQDVVSEHPDLRHADRAAVHDRRHPGVDPANVWRDGAHPDAGCRCAVRDVGVQVDQARRDVATVALHLEGPLRLAGRDVSQDSGDLAMLFQGTYQTPLYRKLHDLLHKDLELRTRLLETPELSLSIAPRLEELDRELLELGRTGIRYQSTNPTMIRKYYPAVQAPDLGGRWN